MGDFNEDILGDINEEMKKVGLYNILQNRLQNMSGIRSHSRGSKIIDGIWATELVLQQVHKVGIAPFYEGFASDHKGIFVDIHVGKIIKSRFMHIEPAPYRRLQSQIPKRAKTYVEKLTVLWHHHKIERKLAHLKSLFDNPNETREFNIFINKIDKEIGCIMKCAERNCCSIGRQAVTDWSPKLHSLLKAERQQVVNLKKLFKCEVNNISTMRTREIYETKDKLKIVRRE